MKLILKLPQGAKAVRTFLWCVLLACLSAGVNAATTRTDARVLLIVWDGLRPDLISQADTPTLARLQAEGVEFSDHHSTWPALTMINASSFATGAFPGKHGYYGNWIWVPQAQGRDSLDRVVDFQQPVFTEDYAILQAVDRAYGGKLFLVPTLFEVAARAGLSVAVLGKGGPTFIQNRSGTTPFVDDRTALPQGFAQQLAAASLPLPRLWSNAYAATSTSTVRPAADPTANGPIPLLKDGVTTDPTQGDITPFAPVNAYHGRVLTDYVLPKLQPRLAMLWLRNPDSTEHGVGPGAAAVRKALQTNDAVLSSILKSLDQLGLRQSTNIMIVSDHAHSHVSGSLEQFPLRAVADGLIGNADSNGYSVSGEVRTVDLMHRAGLLAYDGQRAQCNPIMSGVTADGLQMYLRKPVDAQVNCRNGLTITGEFVVPGRLPTAEPYAVVAPDGGAEYIYVPSGNREFVGKLVRFFQSRKQYGAVFVDSRRYGELPGTLPLSIVNLANAQGRNPDLIVSFNFNADAAIRGVPGIEYTSAGASGRGTHGAFSSRDIHNVLIANGPAFKADFHRDDLPSANVDVAPTIAAILGLKLPSADGRVLHEALRDSKAQPRLVSKEIIRPKLSATGLSVVEPTDPDGKIIDRNATQYTIELQTQLVIDGRRQYRYFDQATAVRN